MYNYTEMMEHYEVNPNVESILIVRNGYMVLDVYFYPLLKGEPNVFRQRVQ